MVYTFLSVLQRCIAYHTLFVCSLQVRYADCVHRMRRLLQVVVARLPIGVAPRLQIRVGRFDSGPRLHLNAVNAHALAALLFVHTLARFLEGSRGSTQKQLSGIGYPQCWSNLP